MDKFVKSYWDFNVGDEIIIIESPSTWSSVLSPDSPISLNIYPYRCKIKKIVLCGYTTSGNFHHVAFTEGDYGWCLSSLINEGKIFKFCDYIKEIRKLKINKIKDNTNQ